MAKRKNRQRPVDPSVRIFVETRIPAPADLNPNLHWLLVCTRPRAEAKAAEGLKAAGCTVFLPRRRRLIVVGRRRVDHEVATFPGYLFAAGVPFRAVAHDHVTADRQVVTINGRPIDDIRDIDGVVKVYGNERGWLRVPPSAIKAVADWQNAEEPQLTTPRFLPGERVDIISGPFITFQATVVEAIGLHEARVLIDIFGRETEVTMGISQLDAA
ncbi:MAG TPA: transcription termination/antitermination NusG family protein [Bosea sp. (in: a-proteobacteria)]|jgi:transcription antitermination factor NusG|uniref:transcription termination/antitermination protein NusG n=1 Tax=Bosea sp. (in: a-proteobacteria) TaxID=1871050 RepID=UPI002DDD87D3|nr:transcription termination/antitermination NusG family protein [Bosea sp. (in: a-proteobacteria)]HEV2552728.1 transcription termination/antitermination NusG family protein [Bosea sp. (in: a-proteobacteria)]